MKLSWANGTGTELFDNRSTDHAMTKHKANKQTDKEHPAFGIWKDRKASSLEVEDETRKEWHLDELVEKILPANPSAPLSQVAWIKPAG